MLPCSTIGTNLILYRWSGTVGRNLSNVSETFNKKCCCWKGDMQRPSTSPPSRTPMKMIPKTNKNVAWWAPCTLWMFEPLVLCTLWMLLEGSVSQRIDNLQYMLWIKHVRVWLSQVCTFIMQTPKKWECRLIIMRTLEEKSSHGYGNLRICKQAAYKC